MPLLTMLYLVHAFISAYIIVLLFQCYRCNTVVCTTTVLLYVLYEVCRCIVCIVCICIDQVLVEHGNSTTPIKWVLACMHTAHLSILALISSGGGLTIGVSCRNDSTRPRFFFFLFLSPPPPPTLALCVFLCRPIVSSIKGPPRPLPWFLDL